MLGIIRELIRLVIAHPPENPHFYKPTKSADDDYNRLFFLLHAGGHNSDEEVAQALYGYADPTFVKRYSTVKSRLKDRLEQSLLFLHTERMPPRVADEYQTDKDMLVIRLLLNTGAYNTARIKLEKLLHYAAQTGLTNAELFALEHLLLLDISNQGEKSSAREHRLFTVHHIKLAEVRGTLRYQRLLQEQEQYSALQFSHEPRCQTMLNDLLEERSKGDSIVLRLLTLQAEALRWEAQGNFTKAFHANDERLALCRTHPHYNHPVHLRELYQTQLRLCVLGRNSDPVYELFMELTNIAADKPEYYRRSAEYAVLSALYTNNWELASDLLLRVAQHPAFTHQTSDTQTTTRWRLYELWLMYLTRDFVPVRRKKQSLRHPFTELRQKPLVAAPKTSKPDTISAYQNRYLAFAQCIVQILLLFENHDFDTVQEHKMAIESFYDTYLRHQTPDYRAQCFLRMALQAVKTNFDAEETMRLTKRYYRRLMESRPVDPLKTGVLEILPFEQIWMIIMYYIQHKHHDSFSAPCEILVQNIDPQSIGQTIYGLVFSTKKNPL